MNEGLLRQRRNLMAISVALLLTDFADVKVGKVSVLGSELLVGQPTVLMAFAWIAWAYFLVRFHQYLIDTGDLGIKDGFSKRRMHYARRFAKLQPIRDSAGQQFDTMELHRVAPVRWEVRISNYEPAKGRPEERSRIPVSFMRLQWWNVRAWCHQLMMSARLTDYVLPYVLAIAAPTVHVARRVIVPFVCT